jgi:serine protease AprX
MSEERRFPLKVVPPLERDFYKPDPGGGPKKVFRKVTRQLRNELSGQVVTIRDSLKRSFKEFPAVPAVARASVRADAIAKSHRPVAILSGQTCPIIGAQGLGELLLSVTLKGLESLARRIETDTTKLGIANLSTLQSFQLYEPEVESPIDGIAKVKLFRHNQQTFDNAIEETFLKVVGRFQGTHPEELKYGGGLKIYRVDARNKSVLESLCVYVGTQSVGPFPLYHPVRSTSIPIRAAGSHDFPPPKLGVEYPIVGIIDSGTAVNDPHLAPWRHAREVYVPASDQDHSHGSFVSGLIVHAQSLNHGDARFPSCAARFLDVVALSKSGTTEDKLLAILEDVLGKYPNVKVWNLSLGTSRPVSNKRFSDLGVALDRLQREHGITFVVAAGNFQVKPYRGWPPENLGEKDRICAPADSLRAIVVGSIAHRDHSSSRVKANQPSPFSRRGPGPLYLPKPEISHIGGNCDGRGGCSQIGVLSLDGQGNIAEDLGTSFATPLVSTLHANLRQRLGPQSSNLSRALLVHAAALQGRKIDPLLLQYQGFGTPPNLDVILGCPPWQCTLTFDLQVVPSVAFQKETFPMPKSLYIDSDTVRANILMTLVHDPELDASFGSEYCRSNMEVSLGTYDKGDDGKRHQKKRVPEDPKLVGSGYEKDLVEYGFKWSPVKVYRREMVKGVNGQMWRLDLSVHHRSSHVTTEPQNAALVITIADPVKAAPVYNEMVVQMKNLGWATSDLLVEARLRP